MEEVTLYKYFISYIDTDLHVGNDFITSTQKVTDLCDLEKIENEIERKSNKQVKVINFKLLKTIYANEGQKEEPRTTS